jgi:hypothetical protein
MIGRSGYRFGGHTHTRCDPLSKEVFYGPRFELALKGIAPDRVVSTYERQNSLSFGRLVVILEQANRTLLGLCVSSVAPMLTQVLMVIATLVLNRIGKIAR